MNSKEEIEIDNIISFIFIILSILEIHSNNLKRENKSIESYNLSVLVLIVNIIINLYFLNKFIKESSQREDNKRLYSINVVSAMLSLMASFLQLYFQIESNDSFILEDG